MQSQKYSLNSADFIKIITIVSFGIGSYLITAIIGLIPQFQFVHHQQINGIIISVLTTGMYSLKKYLDGIQPK